ncbi:MAG: InlB B-repeat-containing protein, partial [Clostridia bacterium]|nr:InlB B-repeat-containing protein [Clostridia bacterium]
PDNIVTFSVDVALNGDAPALKSRLRLRAQPTPTAASNLYCSNLFNFDADGAVRLGDSAIKLTKLSMDFTTLTVSLDTKSGILYAFDNDGNFLAKTELTLSKDSKVFTYSEYVSYCSTYIIDWYSSPIEGNGELRIDNIIVSGGFPEGAVLPDESAPNAIVYRGVGIMPFGTRYYYNPKETTPLPVLADETGKEFYGWYSDSNFESPIYEIPAGQTGPFYVYARWKSEWIEDFNEIIVNAYTNEDGTEYQNDTDNGVNYNANKNNSTVIKTVLDENGGQYLYWSSKKYANMQPTGKLVNFIGDDTSATFRMKLATDNDTASSQIVVRLQGASSSVTFILFQTNAQGQILLNNNKKFVIGNLSNTFTEIIVSVDFANATLTAYNTDGSVIITENGTQAIITNLAIPKGSTAESFLDFKNEISSGFVFLNAYADTEKETALRVDDIIINSGSYVMKKFTADATDIVYDGLGSANLPFGSPMNYDRELGTDLPQNVESGTELEIFAGWFLDKEFTKPITRIKAGTLGAIKVYAKWISYTEAQNAIIYNGIELNELPEGTNYYHSPMDKTSLPLIADKNGMEFCGWYTESTFQNQIYEVPAGCTSQFNVYARWKTEWIEDFDDVTVDAYTNADGTDYKNDSDNGINYYANKNFSTVIKTVDDGNGGQYLFWSSKKYANMQAIGNLTNFIGDDTSATFRIKLATVDDKVPSQIVVRLQGASSNITFVLFQTNVQGKILLNNNKNFVIGTLSNEFTEFIVTVDFFNATLTAYNTDGSVVITESGVPAIITDLAIPKGSTAESFLDFRNEISSGFVFMNAYADTVNDTALRVDDIIINSGYYNMKSCNKETGEG